MPSKKNTAAVEEIKGKLEGAKSIIIADYAGINSGDQAKLRAKISEAGGEFNVLKNRLFKVAVADYVKEGNEALEEALNGPNAFLFAMDDAVSALKAAFEFAKENEALEIKLGLLDGRVLSYAEAENLSKLPSKPELIAQLISRIQGPTYGLVNVLSGNSRNLVQVLKAIADKKTE